MASDLAGDERMIAKSLEGLTLVIPTYCRPQQLERTISFWAGRGPQLLVLDGSPEPSWERGAPADNTHVNYLHMPVSFRARLVATSGLIHTPYVSLIGDDEVYIPSSLQACITELENSLELASCGGWAVGFYRKKVREENSSIRGREVYPRLHFRDNSSPDPQDRLLTHFGGYVPSNIYSVLRLQPYLNVLKLLESPGVQGLGLVEIQYELATVYQGGNRILSNLHWLRNFENSTIDSGGDPDLTGSHLHEMLLDPKNAQWRERLLESQATLLASIDDREPSEVRAWVEEALQAYSEEIQSESKSDPWAARKVTRALQLLARRTRAVREAMGLTRRRQYDKGLFDVLTDLSRLGMNFSDREVHQVVQERYGPRT